MSFLKWNHIIQIYKIKNNFENAHIFITQYKTLDRWRWQDCMKQSLRMAFTELVLYNSHGHA